MTELHSKGEWSIKSILIITDVCGDGLAIALLTAY